MTFRPALHQVIVAYRQVGGPVNAVYAPTAVLICQLAGGAPADILMTADPAWVDEAARQALIQPETRSDLLANDLVLASPIGIQATETITHARDAARCQPARAVRP